MQITPGSRNSPNVQVIVTHGEESLSFMASVFTRKSLHDEGYDVFEQINDYWSQQPYAFQSEVWEVYKGVHRMFEEALSGDELYKYLNNAVRRLIQLHPLDILELWLAMNTSVKVPDDVVTEFVRDVNNRNTAEKTYDRKDYMRLITLSMFFRTLAPIWGHYVASIRRDTGMEMKEYVAFQLLTGTSLLDSEAIKKLKLYIEVTTHGRRGSIDQKMDGISSEDTGFILLALVCIRRLTVVDIRGIDSKRQPVAVIYKFMYQRVFNPSERSGEIEEKKFSEEASASDQNKRSLLECYRKRTELSLGEISELNFAYENIYGMAERLAPGIPYDMIDRSIETAKVLEYERIGDVQLILLAWLVKSVVSPKSVFYISKEKPRGNLCNALGMAEAIFSFFGHKYLATIVTSHLVIGIEEMSVSQFDSRMQIQDDLVTEIKKYFPFQWASRRRKLGNDDVSLEQHPILLSIDLMMDELSKNSWRKTASEELIVEAFGRPERKLRLRPQTKSDLAMLLIDLERRRTEYKKHPLLVD